MAHFARLDENNFVVQVIVVDNHNILDENGEENEQIGIQFCKNLLGQNTNWIQTSYNHNIRKRYAGPGMRYIPETDVFAPFQPYPSWTYNVENDEWEPPVPKPEDIPNAHWFWNEENQGWIIEYYVPTEE